MEKNKNQLIAGLESFGISLSDSKIQHEIEFLEELCRWSDQINLTAIRDTCVGIEKHLVDSLALLPYLREDLVLDVGTGAGLPSIPLAIALPDTFFVSVESVGKKANFQKHVKRKFNLKNLRVMNCRVEALSQEQSFPVITARAFAPLDKILKLMSPYLAPGGRLLLLRGANDELGLHSTEVALRRYNLKVGKLETYCLPFSGAERHILEISHEIPRL